MNQPTPPNSHKSGRDHLALRYFDLGKELATRKIARQDPQFQRLAQRHRVPVSANTYYKSFAVYRVFNSDRAALRELCQPDAQGRSIGWSHVVELLQVPQPSRRRQLARRAVTDGLRADALRHLIRQHQRRGSKRPASGRRYEDPLDVSHAVARAEKSLCCIQSMLNWMEKQQQIEPGDATTQKKRWKRNDQRRRLLDQAEQLAKKLGQILHGFCEQAQLLNDA